nr:hypothetical protein [Anaerolineae bacterium]
MHRKIHRRLFLRSALLGLAGMPNLLSMGCAAPARSLEPTPVIGVTFAPTATKLATATAQPSTNTPCLLY